MNPFVIFGISSLTALAVLTIVFQCVNGEDMDMSQYTKSGIEKLDNECRDNYHSWCFGKDWDALKAAANESDYNNKNMAEDQFILCVDGSPVNVTGNICHYYDDTDKLDLTKLDLFDLKDSFNMVVVD
jgi:hypothetical protein